MQRRLEEFVEIIFGLILQNLGIIFVLLFLFPSYELQKHRHEYRNHEYIGIFSEILGIDQIATRNPVREFLLEGIERSMCLISGRLDFDRTDLATS